MSISVQLIEQIKKYPMLYDSNNGDYKNLQKRDKIFEAIARELDSSVIDVKKRWKNLRDSYARFLKSSKSTTGPNNKRPVTWQWAAQMEYFQPFLSFGGKTASIVEEREEQIENIVLEPDDVEDLPPPVKKKPNSAPYVDKIIDYLSSKRKKLELDNTEFQFLAYAKTIKTFTQKRQAATKLAIAKIMMEAEFNHLNEGSFNGSSKESELSEETDEQEDVDSSTVIFSPSYYK